MQVFSILSTLSLVAIMNSISNCHAFTVNTNVVIPNTNSCSESCLFRTTDTIMRRKNHEILQMTIDNNTNSEGESESKSEGELTAPIETAMTDNTTQFTTSSSSSSSTTATKPKERSGFLTALILAPPLIAKFGIVILVKILTDLVVFPFLFLYRFCKTIKNKLVSVVGEKQVINGEKMNGSA